uniref:ATP-dependent DNA helicase n=1 Tax=Octopus bimaculoides TaxID=37653 RepID=A0A0L8HYI2_OCTBM
MMKKGIEEASLTSMPFPLSQLFAPICILNTLANPSQLYHQFEEDMMSPKSFGGKVLLLGGDFRQTAPIIPGGSNAAVIESSIKQSPLWYFLLKIGNGILFNNEGLKENLIDIPQNMTSTNKIVREVLGEELLLDNDAAVERVSPRIILTPKNKDCLHINTDIMSLLPGEATICRSVDTIVEENNEAVIHYPVEFINSLTLPGMPPHILTLKRHSIVMLLRNLNSIRGLLNGTQILVLSIKEFFYSWKTT